MFKMYDIWTYLKILLSRARCIRCGQSGHSNKECQKPGEAPPKCGLSSEAYPANYKGCKVYKEIQSRKFPPLRLKSKIKDQQTQSRTVSRRYVIPEIPFAQVAGSCNNTTIQLEKQANPQTPSTIERLEKI